MHQLSGILHQQFGLVNWQDCFFSCVMMTGTSSSGASTTMSSSSQSENVLKRSSKDVGWEYGILANPTNSDKVKCKLCDKIISGGVHRLKQHVANIRGNIAACTKSSDEDKAKCRAALEEAKNKKKQRDKHIVEVREEVQLQQIQEEEDIEVIGSRKRPRTLGPMDRFASSINPDSSNEGSKKTRQQNIHDAIWKERTHQVDQYVARWVYEAGIPFHAIDNDSFKRVMEAVGQFGPGTIFLSSKECSSEAHTGEYIFEYVDKCVEEIGPPNVIQMVTDNASNNMATANMMKKKRPNMFWTSCATHTLNLMLQRIGNLPRFKGVIDKAKAFTIFIYAHPKTLALMRKHTKKRDIIRPGVTRFATSFLTLQSLMDKKKDLKVFRIVDGDKKPSMGFLYGELQKAKMKIKETFKNNEANYQPILQIIDEKLVSGLIVHFAWWYNYGNGVPNLQMMAIKILSLTTSSSDCERNWSSFEETSELGSSLEPRGSSKNVEVRELHEEDFISDEDMEEEGDDEEIEFESDTERVLEGYGEEEFDD
ncbi:unnamed protein product [Malus baccata var. baccata]